MTRALMLVVLVACGTEHFQERGAAYAAGATPTPPADAAGATFALPALGNAVGASLPDGWPVWIVRHADGTASVLDAVAPLEISNQPVVRPFFERSTMLVRWIPGVQHFIAGELVFDEFGQLMGYAAFDACFDGCPTVAQLPPEQRDLAAFDVQVVDATTVRAGARRAGALRPVNADWVPWLRRDHAERRADGDAATHAAVPAISIAAAAARPPGSYAIVQGQIVRATFDAPRACNQPVGCEPCPAGAPLVTGIVGSSEIVSGIDAEYGVFLMRRGPAGLAVVARIDRGMCGSVWPD